MRELLGPKGDIVLFVILPKSDPVYLYVFHECISCLTVDLASELFVQVYYSHCKLESRDGRTKDHQEVNIGICSCLVSSTLSDTNPLALWFNHRRFCFMV